MRDQIEDIFFEVRAGEADRVNLLLPNHLGEREAKFSRAHCAGDGHEHLPALLQQLLIGLGGVHQRRGVEMAVVMLDETRNWSFGQSESSQKIWECRMSKITLL